MSDATNISTGKPKYGGAIYRAALSSTLVLPTDSTTALPSDFTSLGYISEDGLTNTNTAETDEIKAWGGDVVANVQTSKPDTWKATFIEARNPEVLKMVYGDDNVVVDGDNITVKATSAEQKQFAWVIELVMSGAKKRIVIPLGKVTEVGDIVYKDDEVIGYETTVSGVPDSDGVTHYEYITKG